ILGRPFLAIARALIDVEQQELILRVREKRVVLKMNEKALKLIFSSNNESTNSGKPMVNLVEDTKLGVRKLLQKDTLKKIRVIIEGNSTRPTNKLEHQHISEIK